MRSEYIFASLFALFSYLIFVTGEEVKCSVKVELTSDRMIQVTNQDEFCSCLKYEVSEFTSTAGEPCEVQTRTIGGRLAISAENICVCAGYKTNSTKKEIIPLLTFTKEEETVLLPTKEKNDTHIIIADPEKTLITAHTTDISRKNETKILLIESTTIDTIIGEAIKGEITRINETTISDKEVKEDPKAEIPDLIKSVSFIDNSTTEFNKSKDVSDSSKRITFVTVSFGNDTTDNSTVKKLFTRSDHDLDTTNPINKTVESKMIVATKDPISLDNVTDATVVNIMSKDTNKTFEIIKPAKFIPKINVTDNINNRREGVINKTTVHSNSSDYDYKYYIKVFSLNKTIEVDGKSETTPPASDPNDDLVHYEEYTDPDESLEALDKEKTNSVIHRFSSVETEKTVDATTTNSPISYKHDQLSVDSKKARENFLKVLVIALLSILVAILIVVVILNIIYCCIRRGSYAVAQVAERNIEMKTKR